MAVLNHNRVMGYMVPASVYEAMVDRLEELELAQVVKARIEANETPVRVSLTSLLARLRLISSMGVDYDVEWDRRHSRSLEKLMVLSVCSFCSLRWSRVLS